MSLALSLLSEVHATSIIQPALVKEVIDGVIRDHMNQVRYCYQRRLSEDPELAGKLVIKFVIEGDGSVRSAEVKESTLSDPEVGSCLVGRFERMQFPETAGGGIVIVSYPFVFEPGEPRPSKKEQRRRRREERMAR